MCPIFLGPKILFLGSHLAENLYFWINSEYNKEELNEKILNGRLSRPFYLPYRNVQHWEMYNGKC